MFALILELLKLLGVPKCQSHPYDNLHPQPLNKSITCVLKLVHRMMNAGEAISDLYGSDDIID